MEIDIDHVAKLARLKLSKAEHDTLEAQLPNIVAYVGKLAEVNTNDVDARAYLTDAVNVFRADEPVVNEDIRQAIIDQFPKKAADALEVPGVFND